MQRTFATARPLSVYVELVAGRLVARAAATDQTEVTITGPRADDFVVTLEGHALSVVAPRSRFFGGNEDHTIELVVPEESDLSTRTGSADTTTHGAFGVIQAKTGSGDIHVERATGPVTVESGSGDIRLDVLDDEVRIKSGSGDIRLGELHGNAGISTGSGDVHLGVVTERVVVKTGSGDLEVADNRGEVSLSTASGDLLVQSAVAGRIQAKTASGDVRVGVPDGMPVWTDLHTVTGHIASNLTSRGKPEDGQPHLEIRATTVSGDVQLVQL